MPGHSAPAYTALGPSAWGGAAGLGTGTEEDSGALDPSFVQGPSRCGGSAASRLWGSGCFPVASRDSQPVASTNPALTGAKRSFHPRKESEKCGNRVPVPLCFSCGRWKCAAEVRGDWIQECGCYHDGEDLGLAVGCAPRFPALVSPVGMLLGSSLDSDSNLCPSRYSVSAEPCLCPSFMQP